MTIGLYRVKDLSDGQHQFKVDIHAQQNNLTGGVLLCKSVEDHFDAMGLGAQSGSSASCSSSSGEGRLASIGGGRGGRNMYGPGGAFAAAPAHLFGNGSALGAGGAPGTAGGTAGLALVVVEGGGKAVKRYTKLMTRRIKWAGDEDEYDDNSDDNDAPSDTGHANGSSSPPSSMYGGGADDGGDMDEEGGGGGDRRRQEQQPKVSKRGNFCDLVWVGTTAKRSFAAGFKFQDVNTARAARRVMAAKGVAHYWDMVLRGDKLDPLSAI